MKICPQGNDPLEHNDQLKQVGMDIFKSRGERVSRREK